jgi:hypothetical protein
MEIDAFRALKGSGPLRETARWERGNFPFSHLAKASNEKPPDVDGKACCDPHRIPEPIASPLTLRTGSFFSKNKSNEE